MAEADNDTKLKGTDALLARIRERFDYCTTYWRDIYKEGDTDMLYVSGNPWPGKELLARKDAMRPAMVYDELSQYTNQIINDVRQNKRAVKVIPRGFGANDQTAQLRGDLIRQIEYGSNAQSAYACGFENVVNRSFGGWRIKRQYVSEHSFDQELVIERISNPKCSYPDPDAKKQDFSDARYWFLLEPVPRKEYRRKYPKATIADFDSSHSESARAWIKEDQIQVAEYYEVELEKQKLFQLERPGKTPLTALEDHLPEGDWQEDGDNKYWATRDGRYRLLNEREVELRTIRHYITNGIEILEESEEPGKYIPIVWFTGKELFVDSGAGPKRMLMSMVRLARDPQMMVNYIKSAEAEQIGMTPKVPYLAVEGQIVKPEDWQASVSTPVAFLTYKAKVTGVDGILGPPIRNPFTPAVEPLEMASESARRHIQSAMGLSALPVNAQKLGDKSGVALAEIDENEDRGSFHFIDNYEMALEHNGRIINNLIPFVYDSTRSVSLRNEKDEHRVVELNSPRAGTSKVDNDITVGEHDVTISTGPKQDSEREKANDFVDNMVPELETLPLDPGVKQKLLALLIRLKNVGPIGDEMVKILTPDDQGAAAAQQAQTLGAQVQNYQVMLAQLQAENLKLYQEKVGKLVDNAAMLKKAEMDNLVKLAIAEIGAKTNISSERSTQLHDAMMAIVENSHDAAMTAIEQQHEKEMAASQAQDALKLQQSNQAAETATAGQ
jgi:Phage P22-like portal protein